MKLSFSTKGWHNSNFDEFCATAVDLKFEGIDLFRVPSLSVSKSAYITVLM